MAHADTTKNKRITNDFCEIFDCDIKDIKKIKEEASKKYTKLIYSDFLKRNLNNLKKYLKLSQLECDVFAFFYYCDNNFSYRVSYNTILAQKIISKIFNYPLKSIAKALNQDSILFKINALNFCQHSSFGIEINNFENIFIQNISKNTLLKEFSYFAPKTKLSLKDFDYIEEKVSNIIKFLKYNKKGNIFIYGKAGVGKNELSAVIAKKLNKELLCIKPK